MSVDLHLPEFLETMVQFGLLVVCFGCSGNLDVLLTELSDMPYNNGELVFCPQDIVKGGFAL